MVRPDFCHHSSDDDEDDNNYSLSVPGASASLCDSISNLSFVSSLTGLTTPEPSPDITCAMFGALGSSSEQISLSSCASQTDTSACTSKMYLEIPPHLPNCGQVILSLPLTGDLNCKYMEKYLGSNLNLVLNQRKYY